MSGSPVFGRPVLRGMHRAALVTLGLVFAASIDAGTLHAQGTPQGTGQVRSPNRQAFAMRIRRGPMMMMSDPAARILDEQSLLQLSGAQVTQLITLHENTRKEMRAVADQMRALMPRMQHNGGQNQGQTQEQRPQLTQQQRDQLATLADSLRTIRWRATSAADSVLTTDQRHAAMRLAMARRTRMRRDFGGRHMSGSQGNTWHRAPGGAGGMRPRMPNDSGPGAE